jgi:predicted O-methyltransferase YrrM
VSPSSAKNTDPSTQFVETFIPDNADVVQARRASKDLGLEPITSATGRVLTILARMINARGVVEVGTGAGVSALALLAGMADDGILTSIDAEAEHHMAARDVLKAAGIAHTRSRLITGEALNVLPKLRAEAYDLVFIDGELLEYPEYLEEGLRIVRPGGMVIMYHALLAGKVADDTNFDDDTMIMRDTLEAARAMDGLITGLVPVGDGLFLCTTSIALGGHDPIVYP